MYIILSETIFPEWVFQNKSISLGTAYFCNISSFIHDYLNRKKNKFIFDFKIKNNKE